MAFAYQDQAKDARMTGEDVIDNAIREIETRGWVRRRMVTEEGCCLFAALCLGAGATVVGAEGSYLRVSPVGDYVALGLANRALYSVTKHPTLEWNDKYAES